jgi:hypothetical protein
MGDSVAHSFGDALQAEARRHGITMRISTRNGCGMVTALPVNRDGSAMPWSPGCASKTAQYEANAMRLARAKVAIWHSTWELGYHMFNGQRLTLGNPAGDAAMLYELEAAVMRITAGGFNGRLVILTVVPRAEHSDTLSASTKDVRLPPLLNHLYSIVAARHPGVVSVVRLDEIVCPGGPPCPETIDGIRPRPWDGGHFSGAGPAWLAPRLLYAVLDALHRPLVAVAR